MTNAAARASFAAFDHAHRAEALRTSRRLVHAAEAEDLVQEAFARSLSRSAGEAPDAMRAWFHRVLANLACNRRRWQRVRAREADALAAAHAAQSPPPSADPMLRARLSAALGRLSGPQRRVVELVYIEERTVDEAAEAMRCAGGTARSHLHRALTALREDLCALREGVAP